MEIDYEQDIINRMLKHKDTSEEVFIKRCWLQPSPVGNTLWIELQYLKPNQFGEYTLIPVTATMLKEYFIPLKKRYTEN